MIEPVEPPEPDRPAPRAARWKALVLLVGLIGLALAARAAWRDAQDVQLPGVVPVIVALVLTRVSLATSAHAWVALVGPPAEPRLVKAALYQSQLVKYLPAGGVVQAAGQVAMTATHGIPIRRVTLAYLSLAVETVAAGLFLASGLALVDGPPIWLRIAAPIGLLAPLLVHRRFLAALLRVAGRLSARVPGSDLLPPERALRTAFGLVLLTQAFYASGYTVLLDAVDPDVPLLAVTLGFVLSWVAGFLVVPLPSGVGVREAALLAVVPGVGAAPLLAASLAQRLVAIVVELVAAVGNRVERALMRRPQVDG